MFYDSTSIKRPQEYRFRKTAPDHGQHFVPGGETAPNRAPQPLDHFKRGYRERADQRDRETEFLNGDFDPLRRASDDPPLDRRGSSYEDPRNNNNNSHYPIVPHHPVVMERRPFNDRGEDRGARGQVIMGLDVQALVDRLCRREADIFRELDRARGEHQAVFASGKAVTAIISNLARRRNLRMATIVWDWIDSVGIKKNTFHYNSMISVCEKVRDYNKALQLLDEMQRMGVEKNEVTFSSAISACEKCGQWRKALDLLEQMKKEGAGQTAIAYNAAISACEKGLVPHKALEIFEQMKREGVKPTVVTYSALISAAEKGQQWKLALEVLEEMKAAGHGANVIAYSAAISALSKGQMWHKALELFREIEATGGKPSIVTYNATMTALEKGLQWERALDLFDEMKSKNMPVTVVSYGSAISACEKGLQYRQCLEYLDEMTEMGIKKNVIIFGAAMSCMEKSCRADIAFQLMERMKFEGVAPNVHIYNSAISACARCNLWEKGYELFQEMETAGVARDVVTYNAVLDAVCSQIELGRELFKEGVEKGFYSRVSRLGTQWLELDLHFLSLGGGEIALGWWFEECLVPYLVNTSKLEAVQSISIVTGYGKTRSRGARLNDDGMRLRVRAMLKYMKISEISQPNKGRIHINKAELIEEVKRNGGKINFDMPGYIRFKEEETTANKFPDVPQRVRARFRPAKPGEGPPGTFIREGGQDEPHLPMPSYDEVGPRREAASMRAADAYQQERRESRRSPYPTDDRGVSADWGQPGYHTERHTYERADDDRRGHDRWGHHENDVRRGHTQYREREQNSGGHGDYYDRIPDNKMSDRHENHRDWERRSFDNGWRSSQYESDRHDDRGDDVNGEDFSRRNSHAQRYPPQYGDERHSSHSSDYGRRLSRENDTLDRRPLSLSRDMEFSDRTRPIDTAYAESRPIHPTERTVKRQRITTQQFVEPSGFEGTSTRNRTSDQASYDSRFREGNDIPRETAQHFPNIKEEPSMYRPRHDENVLKRGYDDDHKPVANRGYSIEPTYSKKRTL